MTKENLFFDLDGTIINSMEGIFNSIRYVTNKLNLAKLDDKTLRTFIGPPLHDVFMKTYNVDFETADKFVEVYREYYSTNGIFEFSLYESIEKTLEILSGKYTLFITTSKPTHYAKMILKKANILKYFKVVSGSGKNQPDSSKSQVISYVINKLDLDPKSCLLIGDTRFDGEGAKEIGIDFYGVSYGFGTKQELEEYNPKEIFDTPLEISDYFMR